MVQAGGKNLNIVIHKPYNSYELINKDRKTNKINILIKYLIVLFCTLIVKLLELLININKINVKPNNKTIVDKAATLIGLVFCVNKI